jgi:hypothetical protein
LSSQRMASSSLARNPSSMLSKRRSRVSVKTPRQSEGLM